MISPQDQVPCSNQSLFTLESGMPIVCLPNHLIIRFAEQDGGVDSVVG